MQEELHALWRRSGMTVVFITHSVEEAVYLGTAVVVMYLGPVGSSSISRWISAVSRRDGTFRAIKSSPEFVAARGQVLSLIWRMEG